MITNQRQYTITKAQLARFEEALAGRLAALSAGRSERYNPIVH